MSLITVLDALPDFTVRYEVLGGRYWSAWATAQPAPAEGPLILAHISETGGEDEPRQLWFERGEPAMIVAIVEKLARSCGTLCILADGGGPAVLVRSGTSPDEAIRVWSTKGAKIGEPRVARGPG